MRTNCCINVCKVSQLLKPKQTEILPLAEKSQCVFIRKSIQLIMCTVIIAVYLKNHKERMNTFCEQDAYILEYVSGGTCRITER
jgi:hypothetical protein